MKDRSEGLADGTPLPPFSGSDCFSQTIPLLRRLAPAVMKLLIPRLNTYLNYSAFQVSISLLLRLVVEVFRDFPLLTYGF